MILWTCFLIKYFFKFCTTVYNADVLFLNYTDILELESPNCVFQNLSKWTGRQSYYVHVSNMSIIFEKMTLKKKEMFFTQELSWLSLLLLKRIFSTCYIIRWVGHKFRTLVVPKQPWICYTICILQLCIIQTTLNLRKILTCKFNIIHKTFFVASDF